MALREKTIDLPPLSLRASVEPATLDDEKRTVEVVWTTGARVLRGFYEKYYEELSLDPKHVRMERLNGGAPLLNAHSSYDLADVIGVVESARLEKGKGTAIVRFAKADDDPKADEIYRKVKDGIIKNVSVGYRIHKMEKVEDGDGKIPVYRATDWEPYEISPVPIGADAGAVVRADKNAHVANKCVFLTREEKKMDDERNNPNPTESPADVITRAAKEGKIEHAKEIAAAREEAADEAIAKERVRVSEIRKISKRTKLGEEWATKMIEAGVAVEAARKAAFDIVIEEDEGEFDPETGVRIDGGDDERDKFIRGASASLFQRTGTQPMLEAAKKKHPEKFKGVEFDPGEYRGYTLFELARLCLERAGVKTRGMERMKLVGQAFTQRAANYQTLGDFPTLLENVLGKVLLGGYATQENTWQRFCKTEEVPDFRTSNRYRTGSLPGLAVVNEHGEYTNAVVPDGSKYPLITKRYGKIFGISRETIINDDMAALMDMSTKMGQAAMRTIETSVYALITANSGLGPTQSDAQPFFHANRTNVNATGSAIAVAGLDADRVVLRAQKDPNGQDFLDLSPAVLLVPDSLRGTALQLNDAQFDPVANKFQVPNMVRGLFREVIGTPRLTGTRRYLVADPLDWIVVAFLEGYGRGPAMESQDGWRIDGTEWKVTLYANAQMGDPKVAVTNAGV